MTVRRTPPGWYGTITAEEPMVCTTLSAGGNWIRNFSSGGQAKREVRPSNGGRDALEQPFADGAFEVALCQQGLQFFPMQRDGDQTSLRRN